MRSFFSVPHYQYTCGYVCPIYFHTLRSTPSYLSCLLNAVYLIFILLNIEEYYCRYTAMVVWLLRTWYYIRRIASSYLLLWCLFFLFLHFIIITVLLYFMLFQLTLPGYARVKRTPSMYVSSASSGKHIFRRRRRGAVFSYCCELLCTKVDEDDG